MIRDSRYDEVGVLTLDEAEDVCWVWEALRMRQGGGVAKSLATISL